MVILRLNSFLQKVKVNCSTFVLVLVTFSCFTILYRFCLLASLLADQMSLTSY